MAAELQEGLGCLLPAGETRQAGLGGGNQLPDLDKVDLRPLLESGWWRGGSGQRVHQASAARWVPVPPALCVKELCYRRTVLWASSLAWFSRQLYSAGSPSISVLFWGKGKGKMQLRFKQRINVGLNSTWTVAHPVLAFSGDQFTVSLSQCTPSPSSPNHAGLS